MLRSRHARLNAGVPRTESTSACKIEKNVEKQAGAMEGEMLPDALY